MQAKRFRGWLLAIGVVTLGSMAATAQRAQAADADPRDDASPWGMGGASKALPMLDEAGVKWARMFTEWKNIQPKQDQWDWTAPDAVMANAAANHIHPIGFWWYFAPWTSADGGTRKGPIKDMRFWRDYISATVNRYHTKIKYWEVWNEFNGSFYQGRQGPDKVRDYADLVVAAYDTAKKIDSSSKIGMSVASSDIGFLDLVIKAGAANHFDFICVHPYENLDAMSFGDEMGYLGLGDTLRQMLAANKQPTDIPLWITEVGKMAPVVAEPQADNWQAQMLAKAYLLSLAQGFERICWFEARGPNYAPGMDYGVIRPDWTPRPSYAAYKTMTTLLGAEPKYLGWLDLSKGGHGFLFSGQNGNVLAAWALPDTQPNATFTAAVRLTDLAGNDSTLAAGAELALSSMPVFIRDLPADLVQQAQANRGKPFPWDGDYSNAKAITCRLGEKNIDEGLRQVFLHKEQLNLTAPANVADEPCRRVIGKDKDNNCIFFRADARFAPFGTRPLDITVVAKRVSPDQPAELAITYETPAGYRDFKTGAEPWAIPAGDGWQEHTWHVTDASFANRWGWHIALIPTGATKELLIKEVRITKGTHLAN